MGVASTMMPAVVTHNYDPEGVFLGNICDLDPSEAEQVLQRIRNSGRRQIKQDYLRRRLETEDWLIQERRRLLGCTRRRRPIYFFLGDFVDGKDPSRPRSLVMPLSEFPRDMITFTMPDSMASLPIGTRDKFRAERQPYHGQVFLLDEIEQVIAQFGMPGDKWKNEHHRRFDRFVEMQVWDETPVTTFLDRGLSHPHLAGGVRIRG